MGHPPRAGWPTCFGAGAASRLFARWPPPAGPLPYTLDAGETCWVRCLLASRRTLYSAVCGTVTAWDLSRAVPRPIGGASLFKSDVTALASSADGAWLYAGAADGSITAWALDTNGAPLTATGVSVPSAHAGRVVSAAVHPFSGVLLSASTDGALAPFDWCAFGGNNSSGETGEEATPRCVEPLRRVVAAHGGAPLRAVTVGADGRVYTGGDDGAVGRWRGGDLAAVEGGALRGHAAAVRALAAGDAGVLLSGDAGGSVCVWRL